MNLFYSKFLRLFFSKLSTQQIFYFDQNPAEESTHAAQEFRVEMSNEEFATIYPIMQEVEALLDFLEQNKKIKVTISNQDNYEIVSPKANQNVDLFPLLKLVLSNIGILDNSPNFSFEDKANFKLAIPRNSQLVKGEEEFNQADDSLVNLNASQTRADVVIKQMNKVETYDKKTQVIDKLKYGMPLSFNGKFIEKVVEEVQLNVDDSKKLINQYADEILKSHIKGIADYNGIAMSEVPEDFVNFTNINDISALIRAARKKDVGEAKEFAAKYEHYIKSSYNIADFIEAVNDPEYTKKLLEEKSSVIKDGGRWFLISTLNKQGHADKIDQVMESFSMDNPQDSREAVSLLLELVKIGKIDKAQEITKAINDKFEQKFFTPEYNNQKGSFFAEHLRFMSELAKLEGGKEIVENHLKIDTDGNIMMCDNDNKIDIGLELSRGIVVEKYISLAKSCGKEASATKAIKNALDNIKDVESLGSCIGLNDQDLTNKILSAALKDQDPTRLPLLLMYSAHNESVKNFMKENHQELMKDDYLDKLAEKDSRATALSILTNAYKDSDLGKEFANKFAEIGGKKVISDSRCKKILDELGVDVRPNTTCEPTEGQKLSGQQIVREI